MAEGLIGRAAKKLEQALGVPRPWELGLVTSVGYQMATGDGGIVERARKGGAQWLGRYATNIKDPWGYDVPEFSSQMVGAVIRDQPLESYVKGDRDILYREMFDLPARNESRNLEKVGDKQYRLKDPSYGWENRSGTQAQHNIMGGVYLQPSPQGSKYNDKWDIISSDEQKESASPTAWARNLVAPILRPATISGEFPEEGIKKQKTGPRREMAQIDELFQSRADKIAEIEKQIADLQKKLSP